MVPQECPSPCLPSQVQLINDAYGLVVDAVLGPGVEPREAGGPCTRALATLKLLSIPLVSLDIPSGMPGGGGCIRAWGTWRGGLFSSFRYPVGLPTRSLCFLGDGWCTLGMAEGEH